MSALNYSRLALGDLDGDGRPEVVISTGASGTVEVVRHDGLDVAGWPKQLGSGLSSSPAIADMDGDGRITGKDLSELDRRLQFKARSDVNGDGTPDVLLYSVSYLQAYDNGEIAFYNSDGSPLSVAGVSHKLTAFGVNPLAVGDIDC